MKKRIVFLTNLIILVLLISCTDKENYEMISEMNTIYPIEIVYFDGKTEEKIGNFPIDRKYYAEVINVISEEQPAYIILKYFFDKETPSDQLLSDELKKHDNILTQTTTLLEPLSKDTGIDYSQYSIGNLNFNTKEQNSLIIPNIALRDGFNGIGLVDFITKDNKYKNFQIATKVNGSYIPSLALLIGKLCTESFPKYENGNVILNNNKIYAKNGYLKLDLSEPGEFYQTYSLIDIIESNINTDFRNKIVIIYLDIPEVRQIESKYSVKHNNAEIVADSINTLLKHIEIQ